MPHQSDRPTMPPAFDVERFARESDRRIGVAARVEPDPDPQPWVSAEAPQSEIRLATRPEMSAAKTDESWARTMKGVPVVVMPVDVLKRLPLDHRAGFLLSLMDGRLDLDTMAEIACMPRDEVLRLVRDLYDSAVVDFRAPA